MSADISVDALMAVGVPTAMADLSAPILAAQVSKPMVAVLLDRSESVSLLAGRGTAARSRPVPAGYCRSTATRKMPPAR